MMKILRSLDSSLKQLEKQVEHQSTQQEILMQRMLFYFYLKTNFKFLITVLILLICSNFCFIEISKNSADLESLKKNFKDVSGMMMNGIEDIKNTQIAKGFTITNVNSIQNKFEMAFPISSVDDYTTMCKKMEESSDLQNEMVRNRNKKNKKNYVNIFIHID